MSICTFESITILGDASDELKETLKDFTEDFRNHIGGFVRQKTYFLIDSDCVQRKDSFYSDFIKQTIIKIVGTLLGMAGGGIMKCYPIFHAPTSSCE